MWPQQRHEAEVRGFPVFEGQLVVLTPHMDHITPTVSGSLTYSTDGGDSTVSSFQIPSHTRTKCNNSYKYIFASRNNMKNQLISNIQETLSAYSLIDAII